jgi:ribosomal protein S18 acetylase RimI-like enzyme/ubiquinone/menaquinone biosynthesis C-methylase UbiE
MIVQRGLAAQDRPALAALLGQLTAFTEDERAVALELVDARLARPDVDDYRFILSFDVPEGGAAAERIEKLAGYLCYGRTPMTQSTYDLYWLATSPELSRSGVARGLVASLEGAIAREGGGLIRVETGSREGHDAAVHFYDATGFVRAGVLDDFYSPGDDLIIFTKRVPAADRTASAAPGGPSAPGLDDAALYDAAFGYRDYAAERDFLLGCAKRFGGRDVRRVLAWACGPARHLSAFAELGIAGVGADASDAMLAYARRVTGSRGPTSPVEVSFVRADLDEAPATIPVDLSFVPLSSIHQLTTPERLERHLRLAASLLLPGGVHVIEATHPGDLAPSGVNHTEWTEVRGDLLVDARFRMHVERMTPERIVPVTLEVVSTPRKGATRAAQRSLRQEDRWFIPDLDGWKRLVAAVPELTLAAALGDFNVAVPFDHSAAWRLILVLRKS